MKKQETKRIFSWSPFMVFFLILVLSLLLNPAISGVDAASSHFIHLPLMLNETASPASETRLVVFEGFYNPTWGNCQTAGPVVDQLAQDYVNKPVFFLEYNVASASPSRIGRFWAAFGGGAAGYPLVIVDSGHQVRSGAVPYYITYQSLVDQELARAPQATMQATWKRNGNKVQFTIKIKNQSGFVLSYAQNKAAVHAVVYEDAKVGVTSRYVRSAVFQNITTSLAPGASATFTLDTPDLTGVDWNKLHFLALADYQPVSGSAYDMVQAAVALPAVSQNPTD